MTVPGFKAKIRKVSGTITTPHTSGLAALLNFASIDGQVSSDLELLIMKRWSGFKSALRQVFVERVKCKYGHIEQTVGNTDAWIFSVYCLDENKNIADPNFDKTMKKLKDDLLYNNASLHISSLLLDKYSTKLEPHINNIVNAGINVFIYNEPKKDIE